MFSPRIAECCLQSSHSSLQSALEACLPHRRNPSLPCGRHRTCNGHGRIPSRRVDHTKGSNQSIHTPHIDASPTGIQRGGPSDYRNSVWGIMPVYFLFFVKISGFRFAISKVDTVIVIAARIAAWATAVNPNTVMLPTQSENIIHHIQARICIIKCLTLSSGICLSGLCFALITEFQIL